MFFKTKSYRTSDSPDELRSNLSELLETKTKFLFFTYRTLFGSVHGEDFVISNSKGYNFLSPKIKGQIIAGNETLVNLNFIFPALLLIFFVGIPALVMIVIIPVILKIDLMTVNDVVREPTWFERLGILAMSTVFPFAIIYFNIVHPVRRLRKKLISKLNLTEIPR
jgi:hypothetical protein